MKLISLKINGFKNLNTEIDFTKSNGISVFVGNNGSGKSNVLEAISAIFYELYYSKKFEFEFEFELVYRIGKSFYITTENNLKITTESGDALITEDSFNELELKISYKDNFLSFYINGDNVVIKKDEILKYLPSKIIALYSGEETRLYEEYYKKYPSRMIYIDKNYWNLGLLIMFFAIVENNDSDLIYKGLKNIIGEGVKIEKIIFLNENKITELLGRKKAYEILFEDFKKIELNRDEIYLILKEIKNFELIFNNGINSKYLSEGEKKQILIFFATNFLADKESIVLLDEPDSYIHVGNKKRLKGFFDEFLNITNEGEFIMTTHSPTLMHNFGEKHLFYLENGEISDKDKRGILDEITNGEMSMTDMEIFLNSKNEYLLITEGKTDKKHLELAIDKLGIENNFDIYPADGCDKLKQFLVGLPSEILGNKIIIGIFDYDDAGLKSLRLCGGEKIKDKFYKIPGHKNRYGISLPCIDINFEKFKNKPIEFMYSKEVLEKNNILLKQEIRTINSKLGPTEQLNLEDYNKLEKLYFFNIDENKKNYFANSCEGLPKEEFKGFKVLFDLILKIKKEN